MLSLPFLSFISCADLSDLEQRIQLAEPQWCAQPRQVVVGEILDGDTFVVQDETEQKIRLLDVNATELATNDCYSTEARDYLYDLILGETVRLEFDVECEGLYERTLAWVFIEGNNSEIASDMEKYDLQGVDSAGNYELLVNEFLVRAGYAYLYEQGFEKNIRYSDRLEEAAEAAELAGDGLWSACP